MVPPVVWSLPQNGIETICFSCRQLDTNGFRAAGAHALSPPSWESCQITPYLS